MRALAFPVRDRLGEPVHELHRPFVPRWSPIQLNASPRTASPALAPKSSLLSDSSTSTVAAIPGSR